MSKRIYLPLVVVAVVLGCSEDGTENGAGGPRPQMIEQVLENFGVDIADTPRIDEDNEPLGDDYTPLGNKCTMNKISEIQLFGVALDEPFASTGRQAVFDLVPGDNNTFTPMLLDDPTQDETPWLANNNIPRAAVAADFDGDGVEETAFVYQEPNESALLRVYQDKEEDFTFGETKVVATAAVNDLFLASGDFDGDVDEDLVIGFLTDSGIEVSLFENEAGRFEETSLSITIPVLGNAGGDIHLVLAPGNLDRDSQIELAAIVNELDSSTSRYFLYDDAKRDFAEFRSGPTTITLPTEVVTAMSGDIALGDVDGDGMDEVVYGGLTAIGNTCNLGAFSATQVLDDARHDFAPLAANKIPFNDQRQPCSSGASHRVTYHPITLPDLDGDRSKEIHAFEYVYEDLRTSPGLLVELHRIPQESLLTNRTSGSLLQFNWKTVSFKAGDVTSDRREDIVFYSQAGGTTDHGVRVWGVDMIDGWKEVDSFPTEFSNPSGGGGLGVQLLLPDLDLDQDSMSLEYSAGSYKLIFTEPLVLAALAAAPCSRESGESVDDACRTAFGKSTSETEEDTSGASFIAGVSVGYETEFSTLGVKVGGAQAILETRNQARWYSGEAYTTTTQVVRETGVLEDSVIFETTPYDVYTYKILSHPNPELVGGEIQVRLPRTPITIMATRDFYNASIDEDGLPIDDQIFQHVVGEPDSYPTIAQKNQILRDYDGLESDEVDVGEGSGFTLVSISEFEETIDGKSYEFEAVLDMRATKGVIVGGLSLGGGFDFDLSFRHGDETLYQGTVTNISADRFPEQSYSFGLFSYIRDDTSNKQPFEVLNYWVVPPQ